MENLWPDFDDIENIASPNKILETQAEFLGHKTGNIVKGKVVDKSMKGSEKFRYDFIIYANAGNYSYGLFNIEYDIHMYPVLVRMGTNLAQEIKDTEKYKGENIFGVEVYDEEELLKILSDIFNAEITKKVVEGIIAQYEVPF